MTSNIALANDSSEWKEITNNTVKSNIRKTTNNFIKEKTLTINVVEICNTMIVKPNH